MGKIYKTLSKDLNNGLEIRFTCKCRLILLGKIIHKLSYAVEWRNLNSTSAKWSRGVSRAKQVQVCNELQQQNELVPLWDHTVLHNVTKQGVIIFVYQFWVDCNQIRFFILKKNLRNQKEFKMRESVYRDWYVIVLIRCLSLLIKLSPWQRDCENKNYLCIYM